MKVTLTIELDLPDDIPVIKGHEDESLSQLVFDEYVNYVARSHAKQAIQWEAKSNTILAAHHNTWGDICSAAKWSIKLDKNSVGFFNPVI